MRNHGCLLNKITVSGLAALLMMAGLSPPAAAQNCQGWNTERFFETATVEQVRACLSAGEDPNEQDRQGLTALHRAARDTSEPDVIEALLDAGADPRTYSIAGRLPWNFARRNNEIKGNEAYRRLRVESAKKADWSRVQAVPHDTKTKILLYQDAGPVRKFKGRFEAATADSITLMHKDGQKRIFPKKDVRKFLIPRPFAKRKPGWITLGVVFAILQIWMSWVDRVDNVSGATMAQGHAMITLPIAGGAFLGSKMGSIYDVHPKHRMSLQGNKQPSNEDNTSDKQQEPGRRSG